MTTTHAGNFFEDFTTGQVFHHAVPRTVSEGDLSLYIALTGDRRPLHCSAEFARSLGFKRETAHDLLVFHIVFGRAVSDISLNSPANLGYADVRFLRPVYPGDTLRAETEVLGRRIIYGGHIISLAHALSFDGLENAIRVLAFNAGTHSNPTVAGDTLFAWTDVLERIDLGRDDAGALRLRLVGVKNLDPNQESIELKTRNTEGGRDQYHENVVLELDYTVLMPRRR